MNSRCRTFLNLFQCFNSIFSKSIDLLSYEVMYPLQLLKFPGSRPININARCFMVREPSKKSMKKLTGGTTYVLRKKLNKFKVKSFT